MKNTRSVARLAVISDEIARLLPVAMLAVVACCGGTAFKPVGLDTAVVPEQEKGPAGNHGPRRMTGIPGRQLVVGELCPAVADGRPGIAPLIIHSVDWSDKPSAVTELVSHGVVSHFTVLAYNGARVGSFDVLGMADGATQSIAAGTYVGSSPCTRADSVGGERIEDAACKQHAHDCGLALGAVDARSDEVEFKFAGGGACVSGDALLVDIDGDGVAEQFPLREFLDSNHVAAEEVVAVVKTAAACEPSYTVYGASATPLPERGMATDAKDIPVAIDVMGVIDLDGDNRREVVLSLRYGGRRSVAIYSANETTARLDRVALTAAAP